MVTTLETRATKTVGSCSCCSKNYDLEQRRKEVANYIAPNTAIDYCSDHCWMTKTSSDETAGDIPSRHARFVKPRSFFASICNSM